MRNGGRAAWMCSPHKALDVPCFDKDSAAPHCLCSRRLWSWRKNIFFVPGICSPQAEYDYTFLFSLPLCLSPFFLCLSIFIPLHCFMSPPPHPPCISLIPPPVFFFFYPPQSALTIFLKKMLIFTHGKRFLFASSATDTIGLVLNILPRLSILPSWHKTNTHLGMSIQLHRGGVLFLDPRTRHRPSVSQWSHSSCNWNQAKVH